LRLLSDLPAEDLREAVSMPLVFSSSIFVGFEVQ